VENFPGLKEIFFDDDTFNYRKARTVQLCAELKKTELHLVLYLARHHRLRDAQGHERGRRRLLIVGYESGDEQILGTSSKAPPSIW